MTESPGYSQFRDLERQIAALTAKNERMSDALVAARDQIIDLKAQLDDLAKPPGTYAIFLDARDDGTVDIMSAGRKMHVGASPALVGTSVVTVALIGAPSAAPARASRGRTQLPPGDRARSPGAGRSEPSAPARSPAADEPDGVASEVHVVRSLAFLPVM